MVKVDYTGWLESDGKEFDKSIGRQPIARTQTFKGCGDNFLDILSTHLREVTMPPGAILFNQNDISKQLHIILSGVVELFTRAPDTGGENIEVRASARGDFFSIKAN